MLKLDHQPASLSPEELRASPPTGFRKSTVLVPDRIGQAGFRPRLSQGCRGCFLSPLWVKEEQEGGEGGARAHSA